MDQRGQSKPAPAQLFADSKPSFVVADCDEDVLHPVAQRILEDFITTQNARARKCFAVSAYNLIDEPKNRELAC